MSEASRIGEAIWLQSPELQTVFSALDAAGHKTRAVGGAVRNTLLGRPVRDVDLATTATAMQMLELVAAARLRAVPTGLAHGTVTVISGTNSFEVTTLRRDVETFGRHARVEFTTDWVSDAARRDFTINALYCDADGQLFDPLDGFPDIAARRVRFIGKPVDRIREDYLRILRFFRFFAEYGEGPPDEAGVSACAAERSGLNSLSGERLQAEFLKLAVAPRAVDSVRAMMSAGVLQEIVPDPDIAAFERVAVISDRIGVAAPAILRIGVLAGGAHAPLVERLRLSSADADQLTRAAQTRWTVLPSTALLREALYRDGSDAVITMLIAGWARSKADVDDAGWTAAALEARAWEPKRVPISGGDVVALGIKAGPRVGEIVRAFEAWWIANGFPDDPKQHRAKLIELATDGAARW